MEEDPANDEQLGNVTGLELTVPSSKHGDEGVQEGVEISEAYEQALGAISSESENEV